MTKIYHINPNEYEKEMQDFLRSNLINGESYSYQNAPSYRKTKIPAMVADYRRDRNYTEKTVIFLVTKNLETEVEQDYFIRDLEHEDTKTENLIPLLYKPNFLVPLSKRNEPIYGSDTKKLIQLTQTEKRIMHFLNDQQNSIFDMTLPDAYYFNPENGGSIEGVMFKNHPTQSGIDYHSEQEKPYEDIKEGPRCFYKIVDTFTKNFDVDRSFFVHH